MTPPPDANDARCYCGAPLSPAGETVEGLPVLACARCGYARTPRAGQLDSRQLHEGEHPSASQGRAGERFPSIIARIRQACADFRVRDGLRGAARGGALDFGCGQGFYLTALRRGGFEPRGVEISLATARRALAGGHPVATSLDGLGSVRFRALVSIHVLEHIDRPEAVLEAIGARLEPGARFLIEVPNAAGWQGRLFGERWLHREASLHVHHFSPEALRALLVAAGFHVERLGCYSFEHGLLGWVQSLYNLVFPYNRFFRRIVLNSAPRERLDAWPELLLFPLALLVGGVAFLAESLGGSGAVIRAAGSFQPGAGDA
jgi:2-polyprenyl-3-methyl-5-hydroxy-6-metoxy-1,4-benzoquinol methylase